MSAGTEIALYLIRNVGALILLVVVLRGVLHTSRVNFYNPISQLVVRLTNPLLQPLRGVLPPTGRIDWAVIVIAVLLQSLILAGIAWVAGCHPADDDHGDQDEKIQVDQQTQHADGPPRQQGG